MIRVCIVGAGFMGRMHGTVYTALPNARVVAVVDKQPDVAAGLAKTCGAQPYTDLESMLRAERVDVADICLPTYLHAEYAMEAAYAGLNVLCEKPMALTEAEADSMTQAAHGKGVQLMIAHCIRFWPEYVALKQMVDDRRLGALHSLSLTRVSPLPGWSWDGWVIDGERSGGAALDLHIHDTDYALYLLGEPDSIHSRGTLDSHGLSHIWSTMTFGDVVVHLEGGWDFPAAYPFKMAFRAVFEGGAVAFDGGPLTVYEDGKDPVQPQLAAVAVQGVAGGNISDLGGYYREIEYFVNCLERGEQATIATPGSSRRSLAAALEEIEQARAALAHTA